MQELTAFTDITEEVENLIEGTQSRIEQAILVAESYDMPDPAPERAKLKSYEDWLGVRQKMQPPLPEDSIHFLPSMDAERATQLIKEGITTIDQIKDLTVLKPSTRKYLAAKADGQRIVERDKLNAFLSKFPIQFITLTMKLHKVSCRLGMERALINKALFNTSFIS